MHLRCFPSVDDNQPDLKVISGGMCLESHHHQLTLCVCVVGLRKCKMKVFLYFIWIRGIPFLFF